VNELEAREFVWHTTYTKLHYCSVIFIF